MKSLSLYRSREHGSGARLLSGFTLGSSARAIRLSSRAVRGSFPSVAPLFLYDSRRIFSAPLTVFGAELAVLYVGSAYLAFRETARVRLLRQHFDGLVRGATIDARDLAGYLRGLLSDSEDTLD